MDTRKLIVLFALTFCAAPIIQANVQQSSSSFPQVQLVAVPTGDELTISRNASGFAVIGWSAGTEQTVEFLLQGSLDGKNFRAIKRIVATPLASDTLRYEATDDSHKGYTSFRVIRINAVGEFTYSKPVTTH